MIYLTVGFLALRGATTPDPSISAIQRCIDRLIPCLSSGTTAYTVVAVVETEDFGGLEEIFFVFVVGIYKV